MRALSALRPRRRARTKSGHTIFYRLLTQRSRDDAEEYATVLCAVLNALKTKRW